MANTSFYQTGGAIIPGSNAFYFEREIEKKVFEEIDSKCSIISITAPRQTGKTSLILFLRDKLKEKYDCYFHSFWNQEPKVSLKENELTSWHFVQTLIGLIQSTDNDLDIEKWLESDEVKELSWQKTIIQFIKKIKKDKKIILFFDEIDWNKQYKDFNQRFYEIFFSLFETEFPNLRLSIVLTSVSPVSSLISETPGTVMKMKMSYLQIPDFTVSKKVYEQWEIGLKGLSIEAEKKRELSEKVFIYTSGHPRITADIYNKIQKGEISGENQIDDYFDEIIRIMQSGEDALKDNFSPILRHLNTPTEYISKLGDRNVVSIYREIIHGEITTGIYPEIRKNALIVLFYAGLIKYNSIGEPILRNELYKKVFDLTWINNINAKFEKNLKTSSQKKGVTGEPKDLLPEICLINLGGTIGMFERNLDGKEMVVAPDTPEEILSKYPQILDVANITISSYTPAKDGCNIYPEDWIRIADEIYSKRNDGYKGFVILSGTDSLSFTASAVAFALGRVPFPVVFVGAQATSKMVHGDATINLIRAIMVAAKGDQIPEVCICFGNYVYRAVRAEKKDDYNFDGFHSTIKPLAWIAENIELSEDIILKKESNFIDLKNKFEFNVLQISQYPGFEVNWLLQLLEKKENKIKAVVIQSLGIGNLTTSLNHLTDKKYDYLTVIGTLVKDMNIPVLITSKYPINHKFMDKYVTALAPLEIGAIHAKNMTASAALVKLMWVLPQVDEAIRKGDIKTDSKMKSIKDFLHKSFIGEIDN